MAKQTLAGWIVEVINDIDRVDELGNPKPCVAMSLVHIRGGSEHEIYGVKFGSKAHDAETLAQTFMHKAKSYAQDLGGSQLFQIHAMFEKDPHPGASHPFRVAAENEFEGLSTEGPSDTGQRAQNMRHTEALVQGSFRQNATTFDVMLRSMAAQANQFSRVMDMNTHLIDLTRQLMTEKSVGDHNMRMAELQREDLSKLLAMAPALVNNIAGTAVFPVESQDSAILKALADSFDSTEQAERFIKTLPPKVIPLVMARLEQLALEKNKVDKQVKQLKSKDVDAEIGGD